MADTYRQRMIEKMESLGWRTGNGFGVGNQIEFSKFGSSLDAFVMVIGDDEFDVVLAARHDADQFDPEEEAEYWIRERNDGGDVHETDEGIRKCEYEKKALWMELADALESVPVN